MIDYMEFPVDNAMPNSGYSAHAVRSHHHVLMRLTADLM